MRSFLDVIAEAILWNDIGRSREVRLGRRGLGNIEPRVEGMTRHR